MIIILFMVIICMLFYIEDIVIDIYIYYSGDYNIYVISYITFL